MRIISALLCAMGIHHWKTVNPTGLCAYDKYIFCDAKGESDNTRV